MILPDSPRSVGYGVALAPNLTVEHQMSVYKDNGYADRKAYLAELAQDYGRKVFIFAELLGPNEDFDGLVTSLEDTEDDCDGE